MLRLRRSKTESVTRELCGHAWQRGGKLRCPSFCTREREGLHHILSLGKASGKAFLITVLFEDISHCLRLYTTRFLESQTVMLPLEVHLAPVKAVSSGSSVLPELFTPSNQLRGNQTGLWVFRENQRRKRLLLKIKIL